MPGQGRFILLCLMIAGFGTAIADTGKAGEMLGVTAVATSGMEWGSDGKPTRLEFNFGDFKAWARKKGGWQIEGWIHHEGLVCGTYRVAVRFGAGNPGCENVKWFSEPKIASRREHCNSASRLHQGGDIEFPFVDRFSEVTCAERVVRCTGNCKFSVGGAPQGAPSSLGTDPGSQPQAWEFSR